MVNGKSRTIKSVEKAFDIIEFIQTSDGAKSTDVASEFEMSRSTAHHHLSTLQSRNYLVKNNGVYNLSLRFLDHGGYAVSQNRSIDLVEDSVNDLARQTEERAQYTVKEFDEAVYVYRASGKRSMRLDTRIGKRYPLHIISSGKAILAHLPEEEVVDIIERKNLEAATENTITNPDKLRTELDEIRKRGYATNDEEHLERVRAIGVPIKDGQNEILGAISVSGPINRFQGAFFEEELPETVLGVANELELRLEYQE